MRPYFVTDGAWYPDHSCGGAIAVGSEDSNHVLLYPVDIPIALDNPYIVERYTAWLLLAALALIGVLVYVCMQRKSGICHDYKSYIEAVSSDTPQHCPPVRALLDRCEFLSQGLSKPNHLYSYRTGTVLDEVLDMVDKKAPHAASQQRWCLGSIQDLPSPQVCRLAGGV